jgi:hypothetical protein
MADLLDNASTYCSQLSGTDPVFLQERLQPEMQMLSFRARLHCTLQLCMSAVVLHIQRCTLVSVFGPL